MNTRTLCLAATLLLTPIVDPLSAAEGQAKKTDRELEMANLVVAKTFCVAMRRNNQERLREMIDPAYLKTLNLPAQAELPIEIAPVLGIHKIVITRDRQAALCLYGTQQGGKEAMLLNTRWSNGRLYVVPAGPPNPTTGLFQPWSLRTSLNHSSDSDASLLKRDERQ